MNVKNPEISRNFASQNNVIHTSTLVFFMPPLYVCHQLPTCRAGPASSARWVLLRSAGCKAKGHLQTRTITLTSEP